MWPDWCFAPLAAWYAIVSGGHQIRDPARAVDVSRLAALGTWRVTQGIYRFDPALYGAIIDTPVDGNLPCDVLYHLPEWCVYIETPNMIWQDQPLHGFFAHLEWDANTTRRELRLLMDTDDGMLLPLPLHLGAWTLESAIDRMVHESMHQATQHGIDVVASDFMHSDHAKTAVQPLISLLLYLCTDAADLGDKRPANPQPKRTKSGWRLFQADRPTTWDVGVRLGAALRRAYQAQQTAQTGTGGHVRPHVRRAHWHGFRSGPMKTPDGTPIGAESRQFALRWLPPIAVNLDDVGDLPATIRPVRS
jgi:hypothetical protein